MSKNMIWILIVLIVVLGAALCVWYWSKNNRVAPPIDHGPVVNKICYSLQGYVVDSYKNDAGEIGGYVAYTTEAVGASTYYYQADGTEFASASAVETLRNKDLSTKISEWSTQLRKDFSKKETIKCGE